MNSTIISKALFFISIFFLSTTISSCKKEMNKEVTSITASVTKEGLFFELSLAQWSLNQYVRTEKKSPFHFASQAKEMGFEGLEYVSQLYKFEVEKLGFDAVIDSLKTLSEKETIQNVLIMVDDEGDLADPDESERNQAVENHKRWVDAAAKLGCHSIRVNTFGTNDPEIWKISVVDGLRKLSEYAATKNINVLCENHGWLSSDPNKLMAAINDVNLENCGTLPDFGNEVYPNMYKGTEMMMSAAKAVSAKSYDFDTDGNETTIDFVKMLQIVKDAGYTGFIGIEYEGDRLNEPDGIKATKDLLLKSAKKIK